MRPSRPRPLSLGRAGRRGVFVGLGLLHPLLAGAAAFAPGPTDADPPTGDGGAAVGATGDAETARVAGGGIRFRLGPVRRNGTLTFDLRRQQLEAGNQHQSASLGAQIEAQSYVWQPWFVQLGASLGLQAIRSRDTQDGTEPSRGSSLGVTGGASVSVFPASRFPFQARFDVSDSRQSGETLVSDFRVYRFGLNQSYRPAVGNESYHAGLDYSRVRSVSGIGDALLALRGGMVRHWERHAIDVSASYNLNTRDEFDFQSRLWTLSARHTYTPDAPLSADTLALWSRQQLRSTIGSAQLAVGTQLKQISTVANWTPREGDWLYSQTDPANLVASVRLVESGSELDQQSSSSRQLSMTAGLSKSVGPEWRLSAGLGYNHFDNSFGNTAAFSSANAVAVYSPAGVALGDWRYAPSASTGVGLSTGSGSGDRQVASVQAAHTLSRAWIFGQSSITLSGSQGLSASVEAPEDRSGHGLGHSVSLSWQGFDTDGSQSFVSLSLADSRTRGNGDSHFRMANLQLSQRLQAGRFRSWSANLTAQLSRNTGQQPDPEGQLHDEDSGWQRFYSGSVSYQDQRFLDVPRLRMTALLSVASQQFEQRALGDINAPLERVTESAEARLEWRIGLLDTRLSVRAARIDGKRSNAIAARIQRRF